MSAACVWADGNIQNGITGCVIKCVRFHVQRCLSPLAAHKNSIARRHNVVQWHPCVSLSLLDASQCCENDFMHRGATWVRITKCEQDDRLLVDVLMAIMAICFHTAFDWCSFSYSNLNEQFMRIPGSSIWLDFSHSSLFSTSNIKSKETFLSVRVVTQSRRINSEFPLRLGHSLSGTDLVFVVSGRPDSRSPDSNGLENLLFMCISLFGHRWWRSLLLWFVFDWENGTKKHRNMALWLRVCIDGSIDSHLIEFIK